MISQAKIRFSFCFWTRYFQHHSIISKTPRRPHTRHCPSIWCVSFTLSSFPIDFGITPRCFNGRSRPGDDTSNVYRCEIGSCTSSAWLSDTWTCSQSLTFTPVGLSMNTRTMVRAPCPAHSTSTSSSSSARTIGVAIERTDCTIFHTPAQQILERSSLVKQKSGPPPT